MEWRPKSTEQLKNQREVVDEVLGIPIAPQELRTLSTYDIAYNVEYRARYQHYLAILRKQAQGEVTEETMRKAREHVTALNNLESYIAAHHSGEQSGLRGERQLTVFEDLQKFLEADGDAGYIKLPTGVGKTVIFAKLVEALGLRTLIVVPSKVLVTQTGNRVEEHTDTDYGHYYQESKDLTKPVTIITYHSLVNAVKGGQIDPRTVPLLILDEAHRALGEGRQETLRQFDGIKIGFTATPKFSEKHQVANILPTEIHSMELREAIEEALLCETRTVHA